jgi:hypothetical protein
VSAVEITVPDTNFSPNSGSTKSSSAAKYKAELPGSARESITNESSQPLVGFTWISLLFLSKDSTFHPESSSSIASEISSSGNSGVSEESEHPIINRAHRAATKAKLTLFTAAS